MEPVVSHDGRTVTACGLLRTGDKGPLTLVSDILRRSGVSCVVDGSKNRITGRIGPRGEPFACKVDVRLYGHLGLSLVEIGCRGPRTRIGVRTVSTYLKCLIRNLEDSYPSGDGGSG